MSRKHSAAHEEEHENAERWLLTYADMITLLMALFIVLYSMSVLNKSKYEAFQASVKHAKLTGQPDLAKPAPTPTTKPQPPQPPTVSHAELESLKKELQAELKKKHKEGAAELVIDDRGLSVELTDGVLFDSGEAQLLPDGVEVLKALGPKLAGIANPMTIEGHTDNQPIHSGSFPTNWELSTTRATTVLRFVEDAFHVKPARLSASGYADTRPRAQNDTPAHMAKNRRVVLLVVAPAPAADAAADDTADDTAAADTADAAGAPADGAAEEAAAEHH